MGRNGVGGGGLDDTKFCGIGTLRTSAIVLKIFSLLTVRFGFTCL